LDANSEAAWEALHKLHIDKAGELFEEALSDNPEDAALMRGLLLAAHLDLDHNKYYEMIDKMLKADPDNPYLLAIFEHNAAKMTDWADQYKYQYKIGKSIVDNSQGALGYLGKKILESYYYTTLEDRPKDFKRSLAYAPGGWAIGPFNNESNIAAFRPLPLEEELLDTSASAVGKWGTRMGWTWLDSDRMGDFRPSFIMESDNNYAFQMRLFFEIPAPQKVLILLGGAHSCRMHIDGKKVYDDPIYRNAHQRFGVEADLTAGKHEIILVFGHEYYGLMASVAVVDTNYYPPADLTWLRYAEQIDGNVTGFKEFHPILDTYNKHMQENPAPDDLYMKAMVQIYNGYAKEAIQELEAIHEMKGLSLLEQMALIDALYYNLEETLALEYLNQVHQNASTPLTDNFWVSNAIDDYEQAISSYEELMVKYPERPQLELSAALRPLINNDIKGLVENLYEIKEKYPDYLGAHELIYNVYMDIVDDPESAFEEFKEFCDKGRAGLTYLLEASNYYIRMHKYDKAVEHAFKAYEFNPYNDSFLSQLAYTCNLARREKELIPLFKDLIDEYPYNIDNHNRLFKIYENAGLYDEAQAVMQDIHKIKPTAVMPHMRIDSLHNYVEYDSIFGNMDAMKLWDTEPNEDQIGESNIWSLIDRQQIIVFESGLVFKEFHWAFVLMDQQAVESVQEFDLGFDTDYRYNNLISARRLRKGQPPLSGEVSGSYVLFKDLKPGDAVEFRYRLWSQNSGDLWQHYWRDFTINADYFQRYMEYSLLTNRDDLSYFADSIAGEPTMKDEYCGFKRIMWKMENIPAQKLDLSMLPPESDIVGKIFVSTLPEWNILNRWYKSISDAILDDNPRTQKLAQNLSEGVNSDFEKLRVFYENIMEEIPYQQIGFDYHASIPKKPDQVLVNGWGDCKDKSHLLIKMLHTSGIEAWPVMVMSRGLGTKLPIPYFGFNHLITGAVIDNDTIFVDPSDVLFPPHHSLGIGLSGQPCLNITGKEKGKLYMLPDFTPDERIIQRFIKLKYNDSTQFEISNHSLRYNVRAGYRRNSFKQYSPSELKNTMETGISERWGIRCMLDSIDIDSIYNVDTVFSEKWYGKAFLNIQNVGDIRIIRMPDLSIFKDGFIAQLTNNGTRDLPADLRNHTGLYDFQIVIESPESFGTPEIDERYVLKDSLYAFEHFCEWDPESRKFTMHYKIKILDGLAEPLGFIDFAQKVAEIFDKQVVFRTN
jgi:tetratricopeptide (TPR) repeat protein